MLGVDNSILVWLIITSVLMLIVPALISIFYLAARERQMKTLQPAFPHEQTEEQKKAA